MSNKLKSLGLLLAKKPETSKPIVSKPSVFGDESDEEPSTASEKFEVKYSSNKSKDQRMVEKVMAEDPNAYKYDEVYDEIEKQKNVKTAEDKAKDKEKAPKYADKIILAHKKRELEKLLVEERKFKKERASEGTAFDDKEAFVTGAYKQQIEERNKFREEIEKQDYIDSLSKVENQKMWQLGFHRKLLNDLTTDGKMEIRGEAKTETTETDIKPDASKSAISKEKKEAQEKKKSIYSDESEPEVKVEKPMRFGEIRPGLNKPKLKEKSKSPSPHRRRRSRSRSRDRRNTPERYRKRSPRRSKSRERYDDRERDRNRGSRRERRRSPSREGRVERHRMNRSRSRSRDENRKKRSRHDIRSRSRSRKRSGTPEIVEVKKATASSLKKLEEEKNAELQGRLEIIKEILKQRNTEDDIKAARERYFTRLESGEVTLPV